MRLSRAATLAVATLALAGCRRERAEETSVTTLTSARVEPVAVDVAIERLVAAQCAREVACSATDLERTPATHEGCANTERRALRLELYEATSCTAGIDAARLDACVEAANAERCADPVSTLERLTSCRASELCRRP